MFQRKCCYSLFLWNLLLQKYNCHSSLPLVDIYPSVICACSACAVRCSGKNEQRHHSITLPGHWSTVLCIWIVCGGITEGRMYFSSGLFVLKYCQELNFLIVCLCNFNCRHLKMLRILLRISANNSYWIIWAGRSLQDD